MDQVRRREVIAGKGLTRLGEMAGSGVGAGHGGAADGRIEAAPAVTRKGKKEGVEAKQYASRSLLSFSTKKKMI